jgi:hypothetical protein
MPPSPLAVRNGLAVDDDVEAPEHGDADVPGAHLTTPGRT